MPYSEQDRLREISKVDPLILFGGVSLAFIAGFVNTVSLSYFHVPVSHMTGAVTKLSIDMGSLNFSEFLNISYIVFGFLFGAIVSGLIIGVKNIRASGEYSVILLIECASLLIAFFLFKSRENFSLFFVSISCGLQNSMASNYLGLAIRTTHMTGIVTDLGVLIGQSLKHKKIRAWKIAFLSSILAGFFMGGLAGFRLLNLIHFYAIFVPASMCLIGAVGFYFFRVRPAVKPAG
jgi:uncharacterized membrane protein YoaK (UPF0700 family)